MAFKVVIAVIGILEEVPVRRNDRLALGWLIFTLRRTAMRQVFNFGGRGGILSCFGLTACLAPIAFPGASLWAGKCIDGARRKFCQQHRCPIWNL